MKGRGWRRTSRGFDVPSSVPVSGPQRTVEAGVLLPRAGAVTGGAALGWWGGRWCEGSERDGRTPRPVPIALSRVRTRCTWRLGTGLATPRTNHPVVDLRGRHLVTPDLIDPVAGVVAEYDGRLHEDRSRRRADRGRHELYRELGIECVVVMEGDLRDDAEVVRRALVEEERRIWLAYRRPQQPQTFGLRTGRPDGSNVGD